MFEVGGVDLMLWMWLFLWFMWVVILFICGMLIVMFVSEEYWMEVGVMVVFVLIVLFVLWLNKCGCDV